MSDILFLQSDVSQLDQPVYQELDRIRPNYFSVLYWNSYGEVRNTVDPETKLAPNLEESTRYSYNRIWLNSTQVHLGGVLSKILELKPKLVILGDQKNWARIILAIALRRKGIKVALRTDQNYLSKRRQPIKLIEKYVVRFFYDILVPISPFTLDYYEWPSDRTSIMFPYASNDVKFNPDPQVKRGIRSEVRRRLGIPDKAHVFVSATKFSARESPRELIEGFTALAQEQSNVYLIALGDGPARAEMSNAVDSSVKSRIFFPGFIPYKNLQDYFFAGDTYCHLVQIGVWEISPVDALIAGMTVVTSNRVGSSHLLFDGEARDFLVPIDDRQKLFSSLKRIASDQFDSHIFDTTRSRAQNYSVQAVARSWAEAF